MHPTKSYASSSNDCLLKQMMRAGLMDKLDITVSSNPSKVCNQELHAKKHLVPNTIVRLAGLIEMDLGKRGLRPGMRMYPSYSHPMLRVVFNVLDRFTAVLLVSDRSRCSERRQWKLQLNATGRSWDGCGERSTDDHRRQCHRALKWLLMVLRNIRCSPSVGWWPRWAL